ncbi:MAG: DUF4173 domain-containing protein [Actinobacteria bacterium]|nr:DUF4173 domain-containing protein [Actinomycetota bacterium]
MTAKKVTTGPLKVLSAILILVLGSLTGVAVDRLALVDPPGLGLVLTGVLFAGCLLLVRRPRRRESMLLGAAAAAIGVWVIIRDADFLVTIDIAAAALLAGAALSAEVYDARIWLWRLREHVGSWIDQLLAIVNGPSHALTTALRGRDQLRFEPAMPYLRGAVIAVPVLIVFGLLLSGADAVFGDFLDGLVPDIEIDWDDETVWHLIAVCFFGWAAAGMLTFAVQPSPVGSARRSAQQTARPSAPQSSDDAANTAQTTAPATTPVTWPATPANKSETGHVEAIVVLGSVCALLALFVGFQFAFLFRGEAQIDIPGVTYAEYARSGFFQLLWVSVLVVGLIWLALGKVGESPPDRARMALRAIATTMILLTGVILISALMRLGLYIDAYGLTRLRLSSRLFTYLVAVVLVILLVQVYWRRRHIFIGGVAIAGFVFLFALNAINPDARIAEHNLARAAGESKPNTDFTWDLGADAAPAYMRYWSALSAEQRVATIDPVCAFFDSEKSWRSWNLGRQQARSAIENAIPDARRQSRDCPRGFWGGLD